MKSVEGWKAQEWALCHIALEGLRAQLLAGLGVTSPGDVLSLKATPGVQLVGTLGWMIRDVAGLAGGKPGDG